MKRLEIENISVKDLTTIISDQIEKHYKMVIENDNLNKNTNKYLTIKDVVEMLKIDKSTLQHWKKQGRLVPYYIGRRCYYLEEDIKKAMRLDSQN